MIQPQPQIVPVTLSRLDVELKELDALILLHFVQLIKELNLHVMRFMEPMEQLDAGILHQLLQPLPVLLKPVPIIPLLLLILNAILSFQAVLPTVQDAS